MWPAIKAVLITPGTALPRYQKASCQTGSPTGPSGASITSPGVTPTPSTAAATLSDGIRSSNGTRTGPARTSRPAAYSRAGTGGSATGRRRTLGPRGGSDVDEASVLGVGAATRSELPQPA